MTNEVTALIPHRPPFLFVDRILSADTDSLVTERTWRAEEDFYRGHYPEAPITPGVLLCEAVFQTGALYMAKKAEAEGGPVGQGSDAPPTVDDGSAATSAGASAAKAVLGTSSGGAQKNGGLRPVPLLAKISDVRFRAPVFPGDVVQIEVRKKETLGGFTMMDGAIRKADGTRVLNVSFAVAWKTPDSGSGAAAAGGQSK